MFCQNCGHKIGTDVKFCAECGFQVNGNETTHLHTSTRRYSGITSPAKFITLYFATFGIYPLFWMYDQWVFLKNKENLKISPGWRAFFSTLWAGALAGEVQKFLKKDHIQVTYSSVLIGVSYFVLCLLQKLPGAYWLLYFLSFIPILSILEVMNQYYGKHESHLPKYELAWWQIILVIVGLISFALAAYGSFLP